MDALPAGLLHAVAAEQGGHLALVMGAGCSLELPTGLPLAKEMSNRAYTQLVRDGVLEEGECCSDDLSALASAVFAKTDKQTDLVQRLPIDGLRHARPNLGHKLLIALMAERAVSHVLSLNFDLAVENAAAELGFKLRVVKEPGEAVPAVASIVHLHGNAYDPPEQLILRVELIDDEWREGWRQVIAQQILAAPNVLFVGLGSPAPVLTETVAMISEAAVQNTFYQSDVISHEESDFAAQLGISEARFIQGGWCDVMSALAGRLVQEHVHLFTEIGVELLKANGSSYDEIEMFAESSKALADLSLLSIGKLRARCRLDMRRSYIPRSTQDDELMAQTVSALLAFCGSRGYTAKPGPNGVWQIFQDDDRRIGHIILATGGGTRRISALEAQILYHYRDISEHSTVPPEAILLGGVLAEADAHVAPQDIVAGDYAETILTGPVGPKIIVCHDPDHAQTLAELYRAT